MQARAGERPPSADRYCGKRGVLGTFSGVHRYTTDSAVETSVSPALTWQSVVFAKVGPCPRSLSGTVSGLRFAAVENHTAIARVIVGYPNAHGPRPSLSKLSPAAKRSPPAGGLLTVNWQSTPGLARRSSILTMHLARRPRPCRCPVGTEARLELPRSACFSYLVRPVKASQDPDPGQPHLPREAPGGGARS